MDSKSGSRLQNFGVNNMSKLEKCIATWLDKDASKYAAHSFRRSVATALDKKIT